ncbi:MAG TPA: hypothetical protein PKD50_03625, partial [Leptospiraceae bacterium]|nr:hypothetical protein [Leptospiraceae bacterium]
SIQLRGEYIRPFRYGEFIESDPFPIAFLKNKEYTIKIHFAESKFEIRYTTILEAQLLWPFIPFRWIKGEFPSVYRNVIYIQELSEKKKGYLDSAQ